MSREQRSANRPRSWLARGVLAAKGFCMGTADVIPGVSGGTMALILGIYPQLIEAIKSFDARWLGRLLRLDLHTALTRPNLPFLIPLGAGIIAAIAFFTRVVPLPSLILTHPELIYGLFFGLIVGSVMVLINETGRLRLLEALWLSLGTVAGLVVVNLVPVDTPDAPWFIFLSGAVAISAMILPGISGSFILLILNKYAYIFDALGRLDLSVIAPFLLGIVTGLALFSRFLSWLLHRFYRPTLLTIIGVLVGSLWTIWPFQQRVYELVHGKARLIHSSPVLPDHLDGTVIASAALMAIGLVLVLVLSQMARLRLVNNNRSG